MFISTGKSKRTFILTADRWGAASKIYIFRFTERLPLRQSAQIPERNNAMIDNAKNFE